MKWTATVFLFFATLTGLSAQSDSLWSLYTGSMDGARFPLIFLAKAQDGQVVSKTGVYLYQGERHPVLGIISGSWDDWKSTLTGRWDEFTMVADDLEPIYGGKMQLVMTSSGLQGFRMVDGDEEHFYDFPVESPVEVPGDDEKSMFLRQFFHYLSWRNAHSSP